MPRQAKYILTINSGSSSMKLAVFQGDTETQQVWSGDVDGIGQPGGEMHVCEAEGRRQAAQAVAAASHEDAIRLLLDALHSNPDTYTIGAIGHRIVHGGRNYRQPQLLNEETLQALHRLIPLAPTHLPTELAAIETLTKAYPALPQVACFDTAFHRTLPAVAQMFGLPHHYFDEGIVRYGFHGLSYEYLLHELERVAGADTAAGRLILAHLGNGASIAAVREGHSLDTTMGLTPIGGLVMSTRSGDLDPGVMLYLLRQQRVSAAQIESAVNQRGGLLGVSDRSSDMRELLAAEASDEHAAQAIALFCHSARKSIGALATVLGGIDTLIFTGGIGENAAEIRHRICEQLHFIGINIDEARNRAHAPIISPDGGRVTVRVIKTNEDAMIARHTHKLLWGKH